MRSRIRRFFAPPVFEGDEDKTRRARLLNAVLLLCAAGMGLMLTVDIISGDIPLLILGIEIFAILALLWLRLPMYRGRIIQASYGPLLLFLILTTAAVYFMGTTRDPALGAFILLVVTAGLLLDDEVENDIAARSDSKLFHRPEHSPEHRDLPLVVGDDVDAERLELDAARLTRSRSTGRLRALAAPPPGGSGRGPPRRGRGDGLDRGAGPWTTRGGGEHERQEGALHHLGIGI